jgi:hypothetical protein
MLAPRSNTTTSTTSLTNPEMQSLILKHTQSVGASFSPSELQIILLTGSSFRRKDEWPCVSLSRVRVQIAATPHVAETAKQFAATCDVKAIQRLERAQNDLIIGVESERLPFDFISSLRVSIHLVRFVLPYFFKRF